MGAVIGPSKGQYDTLQGKIKVASRERLETTVQGTEGVADVYLLPSIKPSFKSDGAYWAMSMGRVDATDIILIDSAVDTKKVAQFRDCIWYDPDYSGSPLIDTRPLNVDTFGQSPKAFEMAYYSNRETDPFPAPKPAQFKKINLSKFTSKDWDSLYSLDSQSFLKKYSKLISSIPTTNSNKPTKPTPPTASTPGKTTPKEQTGLWIYRADLLQMPNGGQASASNPYVSVTELRANDALTGVAASDQPKTWAVVFAANNVIGAKLSGSYRGNRYNYINETINLYRDTNNNDLFDPQDKSIGVIPRTTGPKDILNTNYFDAAGIGSGEWLISKDHQITLFNQGRTQSFGPTPLPANLMI